MKNKGRNAAKKGIKDPYEALASIAAVFGIQLEHYGRMALQITFKGDTDHDYWFPSDEYKDLSDEELDQLLGVDPNEPVKEPDPQDLEKYRNMPVREPESQSALVAQILTLLHPRVKAVFGSSAIYQILDTAAATYGREGKTVEEKINGMSFPLASQAWIISKRIFATYHLDDLRRMIDLLMLSDPEAVSVMDAGKPVPFEAATDNDKKQVIKYCKHIIAQNEEEEKKAAAEEKTSDPEQADEPSQKITEVQSTGNIVLLTSKVARHMIPIGKKIGMGDIFVNAPGRSPVIVRASIGEREGGQSVTLTRTDYDVMEAVGQLVQENGKGIIITPSQIFRKISFSDAASGISTQIIDEIVASMDKLLFTPATIDFTEQIEKHTKLKAKNKDEAKAKGAIEGNIISGLHLKRFSATYKGKAVEHSFLIYDMPMFYLYSQAVKQLVTIPGYLLSGSSPRDKTAPKKSQKKDTAPQRLTLKEIGLRRYLLERIEYCKKLKENKNQHSFQFAFERIASDIGYEIDTPKRLRMLREQTYEFLQEQAAKKNIKGCEYYYKGRALSGITIIL